MTQTEFLVRIYPPNKQRGYHARTILLSGSGYPKFSYKTGWYVVDAPTADRMRGLLNNPNDPHSRPVFQICTREEADAMDVAETEVVATAKEPIPMPKKVAAKMAKVTEPDRDTVRKTAEEVPGDEENPDLRNNLPDEEWNEITDEVDPPLKDGYLETADEDDLAEMEALAAGPENPTPVAVATKPRVARKRAKKTKRVKRAK